MECKICHSSVEKLFQHKIMGKYDVQYYLCNRCKAIFTEKPYWIDEAYDETSGIADIDTGIMVRNLGYSKIVNAVLRRFFPNADKCLDYGGGHGIFTRLMRDLGWNYYWEDKYCTNIFSRMFEFQRVCGGGGG